MASWLASQLQKAENLLEAVDRTVSSATIQQFKGPNSDGQTEPRGTVGDIYNRLTSGPFNSLTATDSTYLPGSPAHSSSSRDDKWQSQPVAVSSGPTSTTAPPAHAHQLPLWQSAAATPPHSIPAPTLSAQRSPLSPCRPPQPSAQPAAQPNSTGGYTVRTHGPFSTDPEQQTATEQHHTQLPMPPAPTAFSTWGPPPPPPAAAAASAVAEHAATAVPVAFSNAEHESSVIAADVTGTAAPVDSSSESRPPSCDSIAAAGVADAPADKVPESATPEPTTRVQQQVQHTPGLDEVQQYASTSDRSQPTLSAPEGVPGVDVAAEPIHLDSSKNQVADESPPAASVPAVSQEQLQQQAPAVIAAVAEPAVRISSADPSSSHQHVSSADGSAAVCAAVGPASTPGSSGSDGQLMRLVDTLRRRLDQLKAENQQLEDLLHSAEQATAAEQQRARQLEAELATVQHGQDEIVSSAAANAAARDAQIGRLQQDLEAANRQVAALQGALETIQEQHQQLLSSKDSIEGGALEALRSELSKAESHLESERKAHTSTKAAASTRERDLEEQLASSSEALAATQRQLQELASRGRELEEQQAMATADAARLREQVRQLSEQQLTGQQLHPGHQLQLEAEKEALTLRLDEAQAAVLAAAHAQRAAEAQVASLQQEIAHLHSSYQASAAARGPPQLEQQVQELQELLYQKQQQLERLAGEKQAQQLLLERQVTTLKSELGKAHAAAAAAQTSSSVRGGHDIIPMDALGEPYQRLARHRKLGGAVQATANFLDRTAASASQLLRQQPLARLIVFLYIVLIHLYVYFLLARMQRQAVMMLTAQDKGAAGHEPALPGTH